jgi:hypothetical protein
MLAIVLKSTNSRRMPNVLERHVPLNKSSLPELENEEIDHIQADGHELFAILQQFENIPIPITRGVPGEPKRVCRWYGEMAKFIYHNLG